MRGLEGSKEDGIEVLKWCNDFCRLKEQSWLLEAKEE